ncbi:MAG: flagellar type III secretion system pore protein FliP [Acidimicrobiales bacterium]
MVAAGVLISISGGTPAAAQSTGLGAPPEQVGTPPPPATATEPTPAAEPSPLVPGAVPDGTANPAGSEISVPPPAAPVAPTPPAGADSSSEPSLELKLPTGEGGVTSQPLTIVLLLTIIGLAPSMLLLMTSFTRIAIVLGLTRNALSLQGTPPNQVLIGLSLFLTLFVMGPVLTQANETALQPYLKGEITQEQAYTAGIEPFRGFMLTQVRDSDLELFASLAGGDRPASPEDVPTSTLIPAFVIGELRAAFLLGFVIFIPFLVIDIVVSSTLMSMGMVMLPPVAISLPFKLLLFVVVDGWQLTVGTLVQSFKT